MKTILLFLVIPIAIYAGRPFIDDPCKMVREFKVKFVHIRTQLGYGVDSEEHEPLTNEEKIILFDRFFQTYEHFLMVKNEIAKNISAEKKKIFLDLAKEIKKDREAYKRAQKAVLSNMGNYG